MGILEVLTIIFVVLKLVGVIAWSWWLVLSPLILAAVIYAIVLVIYVIAFIKMKRSIEREFDDSFFK